VWKINDLPSLLKLTIMAELTTTTTATKDKAGKRLHKKSTRVDLTPMVDLGFLLITFFVFTSVLSKPKVMDIVSPIDSDMTTDICESCVLTAMLTKGDKIIYYEGMPENNPVLKETSFTVEGLRMVLLQKKAAVKKAKGTSDEMVLIVKPADESSYKNFVDILDEVAITGVKHYFIDEINVMDKKLLIKN
jgi:biopolymer transport protein ExbD